MEIYTNGRGKKILHPKCLLLAAVFNSPGIPTQALPWNKDNEETEYPS